MTLLGDQGARCNHPDMVFLGLHIHTKERGLPQRDQHLPTCLCVRAETPLVTSRAVALKGDISLPF